MAHVIHTCAMDTHIDKRKLHLNSWPGNRTQDFVCGNQATQAIELSVVRVEVSKSIFLHDNNIAVDNIIQQFTQIGKDNRSKQLVQGMFRFAICSAYCDPPNQTRLSTEFGATFDRLLERGISNAFQQLLLQSTQASSTQILCYIRDHTLINATGKSSIIYFL